MDSGDKAYYSAVGYYTAMFQLYNWFGEDWWYTLPDNILGAFSNAENIIKKMHPEGAKKIEEAQASAQRKKTHSVHICK